MMYIEEYGVPGTLYILCVFTMYALYIIYCKMYYAMYYVYPIDSKK